jgi:hypothetical protein
MVTARRLKSLSHEPSGWGHGVTGPRGSALLSTSRKPLRGVHARNCHRGSALLSATAVCRSLLCRAQGTDDTRRNGLSRSGDRSHGSSSRRGGTATTYPTASPEHDCRGAFVVAPRRGHRGKRMDGLSRSGDRSHGSSSPRGLPGGTSATDSEACPTMAPASRRCPAALPCSPRSCSPGRGRAGDRRSGPDTRPGSPPRAR